MSNSFLSEGLLINVRIQSQYLHSSTVRLFTKVPLPGITFYARKEKHAIYSKIEYYRLLKLLKNTPVASSRLVLVGESLRNQYDYRIRSIYTDKFGVQETRNIILSKRVDQVDPDIVSVNLSKPLQLNDNTIIEFEIPQNTFLTLIFEELSAGLIRFKI